MKILIPNFLDFLAWFPINQFLTIAPQLVLSEYYTIIVQAENIKKLIPFTVFARNRKKTAFFINKTLSLYLYKKRFVKFHYINYTCILDKIFFIKTIYADFACSFGRSLLITKPKINRF